MNIKRWVFIILAVLVLLLVGLGVISDKSLNKGGGNMETSTLLAGPNAIFVANQPSGNSVVVTQSVFESQGFIVIHEDASGAPGQIIGSSDLLRSGGHEDVEISLSRESVNGEVLYAMLHRDNGDSQFDPQEDEPFTDIQDNIIFMQFQIDDEAEIPSNIAI